jgi:glycosyltransferase involved in cell wall biosynthesis
MQEIKKRRIVLASVLKPVDEPRMFERMGRSLAENGFEVFIIGSQGSLKSEKDHVHFLPHGKINRISIKRLAVKFKIIKHLFSIKPEVLIIATHELIGVALVYKLFTGRKIIYDIQENYFRNILHTNAFPKYIRWLIASLVRFKEIITSVFFSQFLLAEKCFVSELTFAQRKSVVIENKCRMGFERNRSRRQPNDGIEIIFTGTLAVSTGVFEAISLALKLNAINPKVSLKIIGYCQQVNTLSKIENEIKNHRFISLVGGKDFVSHQTILDAICSANFGIIYYTESPHTRDRIPSKLYEYLACELPMLLQDNPSWTKLADQYQACIKVNFESIDANSILNKMTTQLFYQTKPTDVQWESEEKKLIDTLKNIS